jgi:hydroxymethylbilane synthase
MASSPKCWSRRAGAAATQHDRRAAPRGRLRAARQVAVLGDADAILRTRAERAVAAALQGSCQIPLAVFAEQRDGAFRISGLVGMPDGSRMVRAAAEGPASEADALAARVARDLLGQGADRIIAALA